MSRPGQAGGHVSAHCLPGRVITGCPPRAKQDGLFRNGYHVSHSTDFGPRSTAQLCTCVAQVLRHQPTCGRLIDRIIPRDNPPTHYTRESMKLLNPPTVEVYISDLIKRNIIFLALKAVPKINTKIKDVTVTCDNPLTHICEVTQQLQYGSVLNFILY